MKPNQQQIAIAIIFLAIGTVKAQEQTGPTAGATGKESGALVQGAPLTWANPTQTLKVSAEDTRAEFKFTGVNTGTEMVQITKIRKSCGCTTPQISKTQLGPGEETVVTGLVTFKPSNGKDNKFLWIDFNNGQTQKLTITIDAPRSVGIEPNELIWYQGNTGPKEITLRLPRNKEGKPASLIGVKSMSPEFTVKTEPGNSEEEKTIVVTPIGETPKKSVLRIEVANPEPFPLYAKLSQVDGEKPKKNPNPKEAENATTVERQGIETQTEETSGNGTKHNEKIRAIEFHLKEATRLLESLK